MKHEFYSRVRRYFREEPYEIWSIEFDYDGEGYVTEDKVILNWNKGEPNVLCLTKNQERIESEEYQSVLLALFEELTEGEGSFGLKRILEPEVIEYDIEDLIVKYKEIFEQ